ncbi:uncharacterized protein PHALS_02382 [Plasmopara halstedii]|uniref:Uncharacterized protein n=1 Tax=Plasmopara halstedii TaxID=4781 RepID=A0A0P1AVP1_PLAHL|nr:uncharacterized protein PHALS_02382 [Plasmopara halstedii]CEG46060.1 hypothetical protein PHALS_02382 [Plasmopara halstedii]|eukprot:XP_024582429.1 hypothetical protein PHALS_02382 [Plasmopara halstedii]
MKEIFLPEELDTISERALLDPQTSQLAAALLQYEPHILFNITKKMLAEIDRLKFFGDHYNKWVRCIRIQSGHQDEETYIHTELEYFTKFYGETDLVRILTIPENQNDKGREYLKALSGIWLSQKKSPDDVMKMVIRTDDDVYNFLYHDFTTFSPRVWVSYHSQFYRIYRNEANRLTLLDTLTSAVGSARVTIMVQKAQESPDSLAREWGRYLQKAQYREWFDKKIPAVDVYEEIVNCAMTQSWGPEIRASFAERVGAEYVSAILSTDFNNLPHVPDPHIGV